MENSIKRAELEILLPPQPTCRPSLWGPDSAPELRLAQNSMMDALSGVRGPCAVTH